MWEPGNGALRFYRYPHTARSLAVPALETAPLSHADHCSMTSKGYFVDSLITRAKAHDQEALTEIYERYHAKIYHYINQRVQNADLAEDITADVFVRMLEGIARYEERGWPISAWLYRIAHDRSIDALRRQRIRATIPLE